jgi:hypothetical protein
MGEKPAIIGFPARGEPIFDGGVYSPFCAPEPCGGMPMAW